MPFFSLVTPEIVLFQLLDTESPDATKRQLRPDYCLLPGHIINTGNHNPESTGHCIWSNTGQIRPGHTGPPCSQAPLPAR